jgi:hypothetical protein
MSTTDSPWKPKPDATKHTMAYIIVPPTNTPTGATPKTFVITDPQDPSGKSSDLKADGQTYTIVLNT